MNMSEPQVTHFINQLCLFDTFHFFIFLYKHTCHLQFDKSYIQSSLKHKIKKFCEYVDAPLIARRYKYLPLIIHACILVLLSYFFLMVQTNKQKKVQERVLAYRSPMGGRLLMSIH